jgi:uncharacterized membrane protein
MDAVSSNAALIGILSALISASLAACVVWCTFLGMKNRDRAVLGGFCGTSLAVGILNLIFVFALLQLASTSTSSCAGHSGCEEKVSAGPSGFLVVGIVFTVAAASLQVLCFGDVTLVFINFRYWDFGGGENYIMIRTTI